MDSYSDSASYSTPRTEILPGIFLGDAEDAARFDGPRISVHEDAKSVPPYAHWLPIMTGDEAKGTYQASREALDAATSYMRHYQKRGIPVILHCWQGIERSPLTMAYFLVRYKYQPTMNAAYSFIRALRPQVMERLYWLPKKSMLHGSME